MKRSSDDFEAEQLTASDSQKPAPFPKRKKLDRKKCVVCGAPRAGCTGYVYFESGRSRLYAPFCQEHLDTCTRYASPIFENQAAVELFAKKHPEEFAAFVRGKPLVFFARIGYHAMTAQ